MHNNGIYKHCMIVRHLAFKCKDAKVEKIFLVASFSFCEFGYSFLTISKEFLLNG